MGEKASAMANAVGNLARNGGDELPFNATRHGVEDWIGNAVQWLRLGVETMGAIVIGVGIVLALWTFVSALASRHPANFNAIRLKFARYLALALEFQLGADILSTAIAPSWDAIGRLAAIAIIRTALNYFLSKEIKEETDRAENGTSVADLSHIDRDSDRSLAAPAR